MQRVKDRGIYALRILIAGGGTGGHINPGIAIARCVKRNVPDSEILFVGTGKGLENDLVPREGFALSRISVKGFSRRFSPEILVSAAAFVRGLFQSWNVIKKFKPHVVVGTGGYVCGPVVLCAVLASIPTIIHEQNAFPGMTNRVLARFVDVTAVSFEESGKYLKRPRRLVVTGNPVREGILNADRREARKRKGISPDTPFVLIAGGSGGAEKLNAAVADMLCNYYREGDFQLLFATGQTRFDDAISRIRTSNPAVLDIKGVNIVPYIYDMECAMAAADMMVTRGGAITISELTVLGVPSIIIPSPNVTANHQEFNARALESRKAAVVILEQNLDGKTLYDNIRKLLSDRAGLDEMSRNAKDMGIRDATEKIYNLIKEMVQ